MSKMNGAQALVRQLASEGVDTVFGLPGVQIMAAFDALYEHRDRVRLIHFRHEQATTYAAFGYAAATGKPGVALVVPGPGALNATAGLGTAYAASKPVLLLSGQIPSDLLGKKQGHLHEVDDQLDVFRPITKWAHRVTRVGEIPEAVHEAFRHLKTGRPRPVELEIPPDTMLAEGDADIIEPEGYAKPSGDPAALDRAAKLLASSKHPLIIAGTGVVEADASPELLAVAEHLQAPILSSRGAKGTLPANHYLYAGAHYYVADHWQKLVSESDAVLAVGTRLLLSNVKFPPGRKIVHIDIDPEQIGRTHPVEVAIEADAKPALAALFDRLKRAEKPRPSRREEFERRKRDIRKSVRRLAPEQAPMIDAIRAELADDAIFISGMTNIGYWGHELYDTDVPRTYITSSYFGTLGYAFPASLGAKVALPDRQVVSVNGDGGFQFNSQELSTAASYGINVVAIVFNNSAFGASNWDQTHRFNRHYIGTELRNPDFMKLAEAYGVRGVRTEPDGLGPALADALRANAPVLIEVPVPTMMPPFQLVR